ncbi:MAG TPA: hypothetical protein VN934_12440 [Candidatus Tumulicola sp.]|nr:hypothetical protein [Candidatus Tumulicola sp.]
MQQEVLAKHPRTDLRIQAIWFSVLASDSKSGWDSSILTDKRVTNYWVANLSIGDWFGRRVLGTNALCWDAFFVYDGKARWKEVPGPLRGYGSPVISHTDELSRALAPLLR